MRSRRACLRERRKRRATYSDFSWRLLDTKGACVNVPFAWPRRPACRGRYRYALPALASARHASKSHQITTGAPRPVYETRAGCVVALTPVRCRNRSLVELLLAHDRIGNCRRPAGCRLHHNRRCLVDCRRRHHDWRRCRSRLDDRRMLGRAPGEGNSRHDRCDCNSSHWGVLLREINRNATMMVPASCSLPDVEHCARLRTLQARTRVLVGPAECQLRKRFVLPKPTQPRCRVATRLSMGWHLFRGAGFWPASRPRYRRRSSPFPRRDQP
jgi:hypothetical protein